MNRLARMARTSKRAVAEHRRLSDRDRADIEHFRDLNRQNEHRSEDAR